MSPRRLWMGLAMLGCAHAAPPPAAPVGPAAPALDLAAEDPLLLGRALALGGELDGAGADLGADELGAEQAYRRSLARGESPAVLNNLAVVLLDRGAVGEAMQCARRAARLATLPDEQAHIADTLARARRALRAPEAPLLLARADAGEPTFEYRGRVYPIGDDGRWLLDVVDSVPDAEAAAHRYLRLRRAAHVTVAVGALGLASGLAILVGERDLFVGAEVASGGALLLGLGLELEHVASRDLEASARVFNAQVHTVLVPIATGGF